MEKVKGNEPGHGVEPDYDSNEYKELGIRGVVAGDLELLGVVRLGGVTHVELVLLVLLVVQSEKDKLLNLFYTCLTVHLKG